MSRSVLTSLVISARLPGGGEAVLFYVRDSDGLACALRLRKVELPDTELDSEDASAVSDLLRRQAPEVGYSWSDLLRHTPEETEQAERAEVDADLLAAAELLVTADDALASAQLGTSDENDAEQLRSVAIDSILSAVRARKLRDPEPTMPPRKLGSVSSLLATDDDARSF